MTPQQLAARLAGLDWSATSLQHQLAVGAAISTLDPTRRERMVITKDWTETTVTVEQKAAPPATADPVGFAPAAPAAPGSNVVAFPAHPGEVAAAEDI